MSILLNNKIILLVSTIVLILSFLASPALSIAQTQFNQQINYQGKLTNAAGVAVADGTYNMNFWLLASSTAATSTAVWSEARTSSNRVQVTNGLFSVMLGSVSSLSSVNFNQTLYLGVEIGGTAGTPTWDGEMSPRKILGTVTAAFEAKNAQTLAGIATTSFLRSDEIDTMEATSSSVLLTLIQNGAGKILSLFSGATEMFTVLNNGNVGIASSTPSEKLTVIGNSYLNGSLTLTGAFKDSTTATGTLGMILKTTGTSTQWVATSTLGLGDGTFLGLSDTQNSFTANRLIFTNSGATALTDSANLVFDGTNLGIGTTTPGSMLTVAGSGLFTGNLTVGPSSINATTGQGIFSYGSPTGAINIGADVNASTRSTNVRKLASIVGPEYTNSRNIEFFNMDSTSSTTAVVSFGGRNGGSQYAATQLNFVTAADTATAGGSIRMVVDSSGNVGIASSTPSSKLTVVGNTYLGGNLTLTGSFADSINATGTSGQILSSTGTSTRWISTSTLGLGNGTFTGLSDTQDSLTANRLIFTNSGATALTDSANLTFDGTNFGLGAQNGITFGGTKYLYASSTNDSVIFGEDAGATFSSSTIDNIAIGFNAGRYASTTNADGNTYIGIYTGYNNTGSYNNLIGNSAGYFNTGSYNNIIGIDAGYLNTGTDNNFIGDAAGYKNTGDDNEMIGFAAGYNLQSTSSTIIGTQAYRGGSGSTAFQAVNNVALGYRAGYNAQTGASNNILLGYQAADNLTTGANNIVIGYNVDIASTTRSNQLNIGNLIFGTGIDGTGSTISSGNIGIGTTTPGSRLAVEKLTFSGSGVAGITEYIKSTNSTASAVQYGNFGYLYASNTATTTIAGNMFKIEDNTTFGNTIRGFEVQTDRGINTLGENTALSGFARTFGVRGTTKGDAGGTYEPAGVFGETQGTTQGNAVRGYSSTITSASLLKLFQDTSAFTGTGLLMNFGNSGGSFSSTTASKFIDLQNAGTSMFAVGAYGKLTIGDGTTNNNAGIQVGYGGICVDNDGSCNASTTGRVSAVSYHTGNSDLAETYFSNENLKAGEVVYIKGGLSVGRAGENNKEKVIGVVSTKPGLLLGFDDISLKAGEKSYPIALKGRVPVRLSTENGEIKAGDELMLSSLPGVVMKATSTGKIVGVALEDFDGNRAYSDTYINQFGDDLVDPVFEPISKDNDPRINDGCYFGGGNASGEETCVPLVSTTTDGRITEAEALAKREAEERALARLANISSENVTIENGQEVKVGQIVMFVDLRNRSLDEVGAEMISAFMMQASSTDSSAGESETVWQRLVNLANNFVDGVLSIFTLKADKVEIKDKLCVDGVCVTGDDLRKLLNGSQNANGENNNESDDNDNSETVTQENDPDPGIGVPSESPVVTEPSTDNEEVEDPASGEENIIDEELSPPEQPPNPPTEESETTILEPLPELETEPEPEPKSEVESVKNTDNSQENNPNQI